MAEAGEHLDGFRGFMMFGEVWRSVLQSIPKSESMAGLHGPQLHLLLMLAHGPERSMRELAESMRTSSANLTGIIDRLEERGLIERVRSETDRRVIMVRLTEKGGAEHDAMESALRTRVTEVVSVLSAEERDQFGQLMSKMMDAAGVKMPTPEEMQHTHAWRRGKAQQ